MRGPISILTTDKDFANPWIGNATANRLGLHVGRILLADTFDRLRWSLHAPLEADRKWIRELREEGVVAIPDFLPGDRFAELRDEIVGTLDASLKTYPPRDNTRDGFGEKEPFGGIGFDRFDGGTLNRFISLAPDRTPHALAMAGGERFRKLYAAAQGRRFPMSALSLYYMRHGPETVHDIQKDLHRDTFHFTIKFWYFVKPVEPREGPFIYVKRSNRSDARRLAWEHRRAGEASRDKTQGAGGSFRITEKELHELGLPEPTIYTVPANTMVIADTHGFHRRGDADPGTERYSLYGGMRRSPYFF
jgi:hypothetical protein